MTDALERRELDRALLREFAAMAPDDPGRQALRDRIVTSHIPLVVAMASRFRDRGEPMDDLIQVGTVGLINAVDRFDPERGVEFSTFASPTIIGEIKRHFRDRGWSIRVPRRLQEQRIGVIRATEALTVELGRSPTVREIAEASELTVDDVLETLESAQAYSTMSLEADAEGEGAALADTLGSEDPGMEDVELRETIGPLLDSLEPRERRIVYLRFYRNMTQSQIAEDVGISQMHVSRLLARSLEHLRTQLA